MAREYGALITFGDLQYMIDNEGYTQVTELPNDPNKILTKEEIRQYVRIVYTTSHPLYTDYYSFQCPPYHLLEAARHPAAPAFTITNADNDGFFVSWEAVTYANYYHVRVKKASDSSWSIYTVNDSLNKLFENLESDTLYDVVVWAIGDDGNGMGEIQQVTTTVSLPEPATNLYISDITDDQAVLNWTNGNNTDTQQIEIRQVGYSNWVVDATWSNNITANLFNNLTEGVEYEARIKSINNYGSVYSEVIEFETSVPNYVDWQIFAYFYSNSPNFEFEKFSIAGNSNITEVAIFDSPNFSNPELGQGANEDGIYLTFDKDTTSYLSKKKFSQGNNYDASFSFDLSDNVDLNEMVIAIRNIPEDAKCYDLTTGDNAKISGIFTAALPIGASAIYNAKLDLSEAKQAGFLHDEYTYKLDVKELYINDMEETTSPTYIDDILLLLDNNGISNGTLNYSNSGYMPSTMTNYNNLINKGWTITGETP